MTPRKKASQAPVRVRVRVSFNGMHKGSEATVELNDRIRAWVDAGLMEVLHGEDPAGPSGAEPDDHERDAYGAPGSVATGGEPGQGFGTGAYGSSEKFDQG